MRDVTDRIKRRRAIACAAVMLALFGALLAVILFAMAGDARGELVAAAIGIIVIAAVMLGIVLALRQRLKEIDRGEEEAARKY